MEAVTGHFFGYADTNRFAASSLLRPRRGILRPDKKTSSKKSTARGVSEI